MPTICNEEIMAMKNTISFLRKRIALEPSEGKREELKRDVKELEELIIERLAETSDFKDIKIEEDVY